MATSSGERPIRIWWQSYVDSALAAPYLEHLRPHLERIRGRRTEIVVHEMTPPDSYAHPLMELRCARLAVQNAIRAEREGYDAVAFGHMQVAKYGLRQRVPYVLSVSYQPGEMMQSFRSATDASRVIAEFRVQAERLIEQGADVVIPGGGIPMLLLGENQVREIGGAPVLDGLHALVKHTETAVILRRESGLETSRLADFRLAPDQVVEQFLGP